MRHIIIAAALVLFPLAAHAQFVTATSTAKTNVVELRAGKTPYMSVVLQGYYSAGDGGGGNLTYVPDDTTSSDNGCTIFVDSAGHRYKRNILGGVSLFDCGAIGDGDPTHAAADNAAIVRLISLLQSQGGEGIVPRGTFLMTAPVSLGTGTFLCPNLSGLGSWMSVLKAQSSMDVMFSRPQGTDIIGCHLSGITFDGSGMAKVALSVAGFPRASYEDLQSINMIPDTSVTTSAQFIFGKTDGGFTGDDYEVTLSHIKAGPTTSGGSYGIWLGFSFTDSSTSDLIIAGAGASGGLLNSGGNNYLTHTHCYPNAGVVLPTTCIGDYGIGNIYAGTEPDGMKNYAIAWGGHNQGSIAIGTTFTYGGTAIDWSSAKGFYQDQTDGNNVIIGVSCNTYSGADLSSWVPRDFNSGSQALFLEGSPPSCGSTAPASQITTISTGSFTANGTSSVTVPNTTYRSSDTVIFKATTIAGVAVPSTPVVVGGTDGVNFVVKSITSDTSTYQYNIIHN